MSNETSNEPADGSIALRCSTASVQLKPVRGTTRYEIWLNGRKVPYASAKRIPGKGWSWSEGFKRHASGLSQHEVKRDIAWRLLGQ